MEKRNFTSLAILFSITSFYSMTENQWFNSWVAQILGMEQIHVSIMVSVSGVFGAVFFLIWGTISDNLRSKYGRRKPILMTGMVLTGFLVIAFGLTKSYVWCVIIDGVLIGITCNMFWSSQKTLVPDLSPIHERGKTNSNLFVLAGIGGGLSYVFAILGQKDLDGNYTEATHMAVFLTTGLGLILGGIVIFFLLSEEGMDKLPAKRLWYQDLKKIFNYKELKRHKNFYRFFIAFLLFLIGRNAYNPYMLNFLQEMNYDNTQTLLYTITMGLGSFLGIFGLTRVSDKYGRRKIVQIGVPLCILALVMMSFSTFSFTVFIIGNVLMYCFVEGLCQVQETWSQDLADSKARGKFLGIINITLSVGKIPGGILGALFADNLGIWSIFIAGAIIMILPYPLYKKVRDKVLEGKKFRESEVKLDGE